MCLFKSYLKMRFSYNLLLLLFKQWWGFVTFLQGHLENGCAIEGQGIWLALRDKLHIKKVLVKMVCDVGLEIGNHLFLRYSFTRKIWHYLRSYFHIKDWLPNNHPH